MGHVCWFVNFYFEIFLKLFGIGVVFLSPYRYLEYLGGDGSVTAYPRTVRLLFVGFLLWSLFWPPYLPPFAKVVFTLIIIWFIIPVNRDVITRANAPYIPKSPP